MSECAKCGTPMRDAQDWCLQCGAGRPRSLSGGPGWRTGAAILGATALLVGGASVAAYAALQKTKHKPAVVAKAPATTPPATMPPTATPGAPGATTPTVPGAKGLGTPTTVKAAPPKIPLQTPTPGSAAGANAEVNKALFPPETTKAVKATKTTTTTKTTGGSTKASGSEGAEEGSETKSTAGAEPPSPILLDTNAASTYDPYAYPATLFGDPSLAIDGEEETAWTAQVDPASAPKMAEGLVLDLKTPQKLGSATVKTTTIGTSVEIYGANGHTLPASIVAPAWRRLVGLKTLKKKSTTLTLKTSGKAYRFVVLWLTKAPAGSTAAKPGRVAIDELELFPPS